MINKFSIFTFQLSRKRQSGQVIVILLLLMLVALSVGLVVTQKSVTDVATSTQSEQSSRAFSAAEAGLEKALSQATNSDPILLPNKAMVEINSSIKLPHPTTFAGIEYPPIGRETTAQFWLVDPDGIFPEYNSDQLDLYFGNENSEDDKPAVEIKIVMKSNNTYYSKSYYYDSDDSRPSPNGFTYVFCDGTSELTSGILGNNHKFYCKQTIQSIPDLGSANPSDTCLPPDCRLILARVRLLYSSKNHKIALAPLGGAKFPPQVQIYNSKGVFGQSEKQIQAFRIKDVVLPWFDFAIFSVNEISK